MKCYGQKGWCIIKEENCVCMNVSSHNVGLRITSDLNVSMFMQVCKSHDNKLQINSNYYWTWKLKLWKIEMKQTKHSRLIHHKSYKKLKLYNVSQDWLHKSVCIHNIGP